MATECPALMDVSQFIIHPLARSVLPE